MDFSFCCELFPRETLYVSQTPVSLTALAHTWNEATTSFYTVRSLTDAHVSCVFDW